MGTNYECGCRESGGHWFLCNKHQTMILQDTRIYDTSSLFNDILKQLKTMKIYQASESKIDNQNFNIRLYPYDNCFTNDDFKDLVAIKRDFSNEIKISFHTFNGTLHVTIQVI